jgi:hypothetical protein
MPIFSNETNDFFKNINKLPKDLSLLVSLYVPSIAKMPLNKELYTKYHHLFREYIKKRQLENYIRTTIRQDNDFVFSQILKENFNKWLNMKKYLYHDDIYANYIIFLASYCIENQSYKCRQIIDSLFQELGLSKNQHKKNIIRHIRWKF